MSAEEKLLKLADLAAMAERCKECGGPMSGDEDEQAELAAMADLDRRADPTYDI